MSTSMKLHKSLSTTAIERQVEDIYNNALASAFPGIKLEYPYACDGYCEFNVDGKTCRLLIEYKLDEDMSSKVARSRVLVQVLAYMKKFEDNGRPLPTAVLVADKNECFVVHSNDLVKWLDFDGAKWDGAPSGMANANPDLVLAVAEDESQNVFVFDVDEDFDFNAVAAKIKDLATGVARLVRITEHNVDKVFSLFEKKIILEKKYPANDMVSLFFNVVTGSEDVYLHPTKKNVLVVNGKNVRVDAGKFKAFCGHFSTNCSPREKTRLAAISDRLIEDTNRRRKGEFYTPTPWVDYAHRMISDILGENWKDDYVVWDCACGTKNLTRDYRFKELYCSTLEQAELDISKAYNPEAKSFVFDFLNETDEDLERKCPELVQALKTKKVLFLINPPYGNPGPNGVVKGSVDSKIAKEMRDAKLGKSGREMFAQFLYRILKYRRNGFDVYLALFCRPTFLTQARHEPFRKMLLKDFQYLDGFILDASTFADVGSWALSFNIWKPGETVDKQNFVHSIATISDDGVVSSGSSKAIYNIDGLLSIDKWARDPSPKDTEFPNFRSPLNFEVYQEGVAKTTANALGQWFYGMDIWHFSTMNFWVGGHCKTISQANFAKTCIYDAVLHLRGKDWTSSWDESVLPAGIDSVFSLDAVVHFLLDDRGYDFSLRRVEYHGKTWDIPNHFFFLSRQEALDLSDTHNLTETYMDANTDKDRFVYLKLQEIYDDLSPEAKAVLDEARDLVRKSWKYRRLYNEEHPEVQILNWDAGWYQIKKMLKVYMPEELKHFQKVTLKALKDKMRPMVYELGFLKK